ncbi:uncharacterized protein N7473_009515 [Penicillium subrubescens]|uniref:Uncharacterized protein n=1 Tax=Penicillium subrubescens TaxID=1316194 RepID=A0A1Q5TBD4_9EURO|nr:uncharacterized protein N7473_009515 [Penicillium subrubescens]KAJ5886841.1 hypothetical protein N7473_009515 [Penicillium subrubescens]OKO97511.1 hypothetical protein PENSUB_10305 [Penicillium subrubescens]
MECTRRQFSYATWRLQVFRQLLGPSPAPPSRRYLSGSQIRADEAPSGTTLPPSKRLPQSPLVTSPRPGPIKDRKRLPTPDDTFELKKNPWAVALASPVRMCSVTGARIPRDLLGEWGLVRKPDTENSYLLPVDLIKDSLQARKETGSLVPEKAPYLDPATISADTPLTAKAIRNEKPGQQLLLRMLNSLHLLKGLARPLSKNAGKRPAISRLLPFRWKHPLGPITSRVEKSILWRPDMADHVLLQRRTDVVKKLEKARWRYARMDIPGGVWSVLDIQESSTTALADALERLGSFDRMASGAVLLLAPSGNGGSWPETVFNPSTQSQVPVFDLTTLLSESDLAKLRDAEAPHFRNAALFFRPDNHLGVETILALWKLQRFMTETPS